MLPLLSRIGFRSREQTTIDTPPAGEWYIAPKADGWYGKNSAGVETLLGAGSGGGSTPARVTSSTVSNSIVAGGHASTTVPLAISYRLLSLTVNNACRVRLFTTAAGATADIGRSITDDPPDGRGVILDYVATHAGTFILSPLVDGSSMESSPSANISALVDNPGVSTTTIDVSFVYIPTE